MSNNNREGGDGGGAIFFLFLIIAAIIAVIFLTLSIGAIYGGAKAIYNYAIAFNNNVALEKPGAG